MQHTEPLLLLQQPTLKIHFPPRNPTFSLMILLRVNENIIQFVAQPPDLAPKFIQYSLSSG